MTIERTTVSINKAKDAGNMDAHIGFARVLRRVFPATMAGYLSFRGCIRQKTLFGRSAVTFDLRQRGGRLQGWLGRAVGLGDGSCGLADGGYCSAGMMQRYGIAGHGSGSARMGRTSVAWAQAAPETLPSGLVGPPGMFRDAGRHVDAAGDNRRMTGSGCDRGHGGCRHGSPGPERRFLWSASRSIALSMSAS